VPGLGVDAQILEVLAAERRLPNNALASRVGIPCDFLAVHRGAREPSRGELLAGRVQQPRPGPRPLLRSRPSPWRGVVITAHTVEAA